MLRALALALSVLALAPAGGCTPSPSEGTPTPVAVDLARPLVLVAVEDPGGVLARISDAVREDPASGLGVDEAKIGAPGRPTIHEVFPTGPSRQVLEDYVKAHPELAPPAGFTFAYERLGRDAPADGSWRLHCLRQAGALELRHLAGAEIRDQLGRHEILITLGPDDGAAFGRLTTELVGTRMAVVHGGEVLMAPMVHESITGGAFSISLGGDGSPEAAKAALARLIGS